MTNTRRVLASGLVRQGLIPYEELDVANSIVAADIVNGTLTDAEFNASAALDVSKLDVGSNGQVLAVDSGVAVWSDVSDLPPTPATARPAGEVAWFAGATAPSGWLVADGTSYLRADYADLFDYIGTLHGAVDGTHFSVPNLVGKHMRGAAADGSNVGGTGGSDSATLVAGNLPAHTHSVSIVSAATSAGTPSGAIDSISGGTPAGSIDAQGGHTPTGAINSV